MRPIELTLDGFRSFHGAQTLRWEGRRLVGIVGPIGSGKSSILDGISFALYGKTPRIARDVLGLINQRRDQGSVALLFEVDGIAWRVVRSLRRTGQPAHALYRVEGDEEVRVEVPVSLVDANWICGCIGPALISSPSTPIRLRWRGPPTAVTARAGIAPV